jgi:uncharacterized protein
MNPVDPIVVVFAKVPGLGMAKSRIAAVVGVERADQIYRELLAQTAAAVAGHNHYLAFTGADEPGELLSVFDRAAGTVRQTGATLGERMANAMRFAFERGHTHVCLIACDCPSRDGALVQKSLSMATQADLIFGPAADGGYYLVQTGPACMDIFSVNSWGAPSLLKDSMALADNRGWSYRLLCTLRDVDTYDDYLTWKGTEV